MFKTNNASAVVIAVIVIVVLAIVAGGIYWWQQFNSWEKTRIIYADVQFDENDNGFVDPTDMIFYSIRADGTGQKELFTIKGDELWFQWDFPDIKFCFNSQKMYSIAERNTRTIREINLDGTFRDLKFSGIDASEYFGGYQYNKPHDLGFILSPDCQKIITSTVFFAKDDAVNEIIIYDINKSERKVLSTMHHQGYIFPSIFDFPNTFPVKYIKKWSSKNPEIVYLIDVNGGLYTININTGIISKIADFGERQMIDDISPNERLVTYYSYPPAEPPAESFGSFVIDLESDLKISIQNGSGDREFSPDSKKLAYIDIDFGEEWVPNLYVSDFENENKKISNNTELRGWLSDNIILGQKENSLITINSKGTKEKHIVTTKGSLVFIAIIK